MNKPVETIAVTATGEVDINDVQPGEEVVIIRKRMNWRQSRAVQNVISKFKADGSMDSFLGDGQTEMLFQSLVSWRGGRFEGVAISREAINEMDGDLTILNNAANLVTQNNYTNTTNEPAPNPTNPAPESTSSTSA